MQSLKCLLAVGVAVCALSVRGVDNDAQAKAREALEKKLNELQAQPATPSEPAKSAPQPKQAKPPAPKQPPISAPAPAVPASTINAPSATDPTSIEKARQAMREKMSTLQPAATEVASPAPAPKITVQPPAEPSPAQASTPPPTATPSAAPPPAVVAAPAAVVAAPAAASSVVSTPPPTASATADLPPPSDPEAIAKAREALRQKMNELQGTQPAPAPLAPPTAPAPTVGSQPPTAPAPAVPTTPTPTAATAPVQPPSTPDLTAPPEADPAAIAKARDAMRQRMQMLPPDTQGASETVSLGGRASKTSMNFPRLQGPPLPIGADKEQRL